MNCYRLAEIYHQNPEVFLDMPLSRMGTHCHYTIKMKEAQARARRRREDDDED